MTFSVLPNFRFSSFKWLDNILQLELRREKINHSMSINLKYAEISIDLLLPHVRPRD